jgi:acetyl esterase/lipase
MQKITDTSLNLTFHPSPSKNPRGTVIVCPGGGYQGLAPHEAEPIADWLNSFGLNAFVLRYRVAPNQHPAPLSDITHAVRLVRSRASEFNTTPNKIAILGFSAGGHLVTTLATHFDPGNPSAQDSLDRASSRPDAVIACYPVISLQAIPHVGSLKNLLGENPSPDIIQNLSNDQQVTENTPPTFLWHTADDPVVPVEHSLLFALACAKNKVPHELHIFPHGKHGLGLANETSPIGQSPQVAQWTTLCQTWLESLGF